MIKIFGIYLLNRSEIEETADTLRNIADETIRNALDPVIDDLEELRKNTWDQDRITRIQHWIKIFEDEDEE